MPRLDDLFDVLLARGGSDLHLSVGHPPLIRSRGELVQIRVKEIDEGEMHSLAFEILTPAQKAALDSDLDVDFAYAYRDRARFRVNYFQKQGGLGAVFRVVPTHVRSLDDLAAPASLKMIAAKTSGLVLVSGPSGAGKSTTLAALVEAINRERACHILTIEDPVEFVHTPIKSQITQREIGPDAGSFAAAIRNAGREDADVVMISELRTAESLKLALQLASSGVLVFGGLLTNNNAAMTIDRLLGSFVAEEQAQLRALLADNLVALVAQQLIRTADGKSRVAAHEILLGSVSLASMIRESKTHQIQNMMQAGQAAGMQTMDMALERLVKIGMITPEAALERAHDKELMRTFRVE